MVIVTFDAALAAILALCDDDVMGSVSRAIDPLDDESDSCAHTRIKHEPIDASRPTNPHDYATIFPCGCFDGTLNLEAWCGGLTLCADRDGREAHWHLEEPNEPGCVGEPVVELAVALREAAEFIGWQLASATGAGDE